MSYKLLEDLGDIYSHISSYEQNYLNEESEYFDEQSSRDIENVILTVSYNLIREGHDANYVINYLANEPEQVILETYYRTYLSESTIPDEYIEEELYIICEKLGLLKGLGTLFTKGGKAAKTAATATRSATRTGITKAAEVGVERRVGQQLLKSSDPSKTTAALERLARQKATKAGINAPSGALTAKQSTDLLKQARATRAIQGVKSGLKTALLAGTGVLTGYTAAKLAGGGKKDTDAKTAPTLTPAAPSAPSAPSGTPSAPSGTDAKVKPSAPSKDEINKQYRDLIKQGKTKEAEKFGLEAWKKAHPDLAKKLNADGTQKGTGESQMEKDAEELRRMTNRSKQRQGELMGGPEGPGEIDKGDVEASIKAQKERDKKRAEESTKKESVDAYDIVLDYLFETGQADSVSEAHYIMLQMEAAHVQQIVEADSVEAMRARAAKRRQQRYGKSGGGGRDDYRPYTEDDYKKGEEKEA